ncbi:unnamed protein product [Hymenolepis diminuta]|uniref:Uncharacterized protein n=1 Tax=Hymenolepis diminuta TaxID=6216 RepID=A0A564Z1K8_HYMDI|nr:unnamed protein product [Hymenolepis diminuta]
MRRQRVSSRSIHNFTSYLEGIEKKLLNSNRCADNFFSDAIWKENVGIHSCLLEGSTDECMLAIKVSTEISKLKPFQFRKKLSIFTAAVLDCMNRLKSNDFSVECIGNFLNKINSASISDPSLIISAFVNPSLLKTISETLPSNVSANEQLFHFVTD